ncbi:hypothetical protein Taro_029022 [Colocasia esculenta]|uniref:Uncharacterized protein n=1 Tax=Colocasia esculenta TaxID=4460 RepID=A0A843VPX0_COLES|nr:hypothetical protein [Colocasia esculenta]
MVEWLENATGLVTLYDLSKTKPYESGLVRTLLRQEEAKAAWGWTEGQQNGRSAARRWRRSCTRT